MQINYILSVIVHVDLRLKFMTVLMLIVLAVSVTITVLRFGLNPLWADHFVPELSAHYQTSAMFAAFYGLLNFYVFTMAFVYSPSRNAVFGQLLMLTLTHFCVVSFMLDRAADRLKILIAINRTITIFNRD